MGLKRFNPKAEFYGSWNPITWKQESHTRRFLDVQGRKSLSNPRHLYIQPLICLKTYFECLPQSRRCAMSWSCQGSEKNLHSSVLAGLTVHRGRRTSAREDLTSQCTVGDPLRDAKAQPVRSVREERHLAVLREHVTGDVAEVSVSGSCD